MFSCQFSGIIGFIFFLELTAAVLAVVFQSQVRAWINEFFVANIKAYRDDIDLQNLIDSLQRMVIFGSYCFYCSSFKYKVKGLMGIQKTQKDLVKPFGSRSLTEPLLWGSEPRRLG